MIGAREVLPPGRFFVCARIAVLPPGKRAAILPHPPLHLDFHQGFQDHGFLP